MLLEELKETLVVDARVPLPVDAEPPAGDEHAAAVGMLGGDAVVQPALPQLLVERGHELGDLGVERDVGHGEAGAGARRGPAVRDALDLDEAREAALDEVRVPLDLVVDVEALDEGEAEDGAVLEALLAEDVETPLEPLPEVAVQGSVDLAQGLLVARVDGDVELCHGLQGRQLVRVLRVADEEAGDSLRVQHP